MPIVLIFAAREVFGLSDDRLMPIRESTCRRVETY